MTLESSLWTAFSAVLPAWHAVRIENNVELGTPDVNFCASGVDYWVELKVAKLPRNALTRVAVEHFTFEQRTWLVDRCKAGGRAYMLLQAGDVYLWIRGDVAALHVGWLPLGRLARRAEWSGKDLRGLIAYLKCVYETNMT